MQNIPFTANFSNFWFLFILTWVFMYFLKFKQKTYAQRRMSDLLLLREYYLKNWIIINSLIVWLLIGHLNITERKQSLECSKAARSDEDHKSFDHWNLLKQNKRVSKLEFGDYEINSHKTRVPSPNKCVLLCKTHFFNLWNSFDSINIYYGVNPGHTERNIGELRIFEQGCLCK